MWVNWLSDPADDGETVHIVLTFSSASGIPDGSFTRGGIDNVNFFIGTTPIPVPAAVWLFGSGLVGLIGLARRK
jgi:hypothetical protein